MSHIDVMKQALEALEQWNTPLYKRGNVITALRRALAVSETHKQPAAPQRSEDKKQWAGLTDEEIVQLSQEWPPETNDWASHIDFTRAIEAKLKEKNGY